MTDEHGELRRRERRPSFRGQAGELSDDVLLQLGYGKGERRTAVINLVLADQIESRVQHARRSKHDGRAASASPAC